MMASFDPVPAPRAAPPVNGLLATLKPEISTGHWPIHGISYEPEGCVEGDTVNPCGHDALGNLTKPDSVEWMAYKLTVSETCSTFSGDYSERQARARRLMEQDTERQIGHELWTGELSSAETLPDGVTDWPNTWLANVADVDILSESGPVALIQGLACLEQYLSSRNGGTPGMIHATAQTVVHWDSFGLLTREGNTLYTRLRNRVISSPGYPGTDPNGNVGDNNIWAYATDDIRVFLGPIQTFAPVESYDHQARDNTFRFAAERPALAEWQRCRHGGVRLALTECDTGGS